MFHNAHSILCDAVYCYQVGCTLAARFYRKVVGYMPYSLGLYRVEYKQEVRGNVELEDMEYDNAMGGNTALQNRIAMKIKSELHLSGWINFTDLTLDRLRNADTPSGCACECYACDQMSLHCRNRRKECYI